MFDASPEEYPDWGPVFLSAASKAIALKWYRKAQRARAGKKGMHKRDKVIKEISDDEGDDVPKSWTKQMQPVSSSTHAMALFWLQTARTRLLKRAGKGGGVREKDIDIVEEAPAGDVFRSGKKSKSLRK